MILNDKCTSVLYAVVACSVCYCSIFVWGLRKILVGLACYGAINRIMDVDNVESLLYVANILAWFSPLIMRVRAADESPSVYAKSELTVSDQRCVSYKIKTTYEAQIIIIIIIIIITCDLVHTRWQGSFLTYEGRTESHEQQFFVK